MQQVGKFIVIAGLMIAVIGVLIWLLGDRLHWFGNLPGDIRVERENFRFYFPITTMVILSIAVSVILWIIRRFI